MVLEKEMSTALKELHSLVEEGRRIVHREMQSAENLIGNNVRKFSSNLQTISQHAMQSLQSYQHCVQDDYEMAINMLALMECIEFHHQQLMNLFTNLLQQAPKLEDVVGKTTATAKYAKASKAFAFQVIGSNAADFFMMMSNLDSLGNGSNDSDGVDNMQSQLDAELQQEIALKKKKSTPTNSKTVTNQDSNKISFRTLELARLYKILCSNNRGNTISNGGIASNRVYAMVSLEDLTIILTQGWSQLTSSNANIRSAQICSSNPNLLAYLMEDCNFVYELNQTNGNNKAQCGKLIFMIR